MPRTVYVPLLDNGLGMGMTDFFACFLEAFAFRKYEFKRVSDSNIQRARNRASADFLHSDCDEVLFLDSDIKGFNRETIDMLFSHDVPIVCGVYPIKEPGLKLCVGTITNEFPITSDALVEVRRAGSGFMRIKREVFDAMKEENGGQAKAYYNHGRVEWDFWKAGVYDPPMAAMDGEFLCENWALCEHARALGYRVMVDQRIVLQHRGLIDFPIPGTYKTE